MSKPWAPALASHVSLRMSLFVLLPMIFLAPAVGAPLTRSYFFATQAACTASGILTDRECSQAFKNAQAELLDRVARFSSLYECRLRFRFCQSAPPAERTMVSDSTQTPSYVPTALGVEIIVSRESVRVAPTLAVETSLQDFPFISVFRAYSVEQEEQEMVGKLLKTGILPTDHFKPYLGSVAAHTVGFAAAALGSLETPINRTERVETFEERRQRLKSAPLIE